MTWHAKRWVFLVAVVVVEKIGNWELKSNTPDMMTIQRDKMVITGLSPVCYNYRPYSHYRYWVGRKW
jgi:hypothetical protein